MLKISLIFHMYSKLPLYVASEEFRDGGFLDERQNRNAGAGGSGVFCV
jgi:hypothetical protein